MGKIKGRPPLILRHLSEVPYGKRVGRTILVADEVLGNEIVWEPLADLDDNKSGETSYSIAVVLEEYTDNERERVVYLTSNGVTFNGAVVFLWEIVGVTELE